MNEKTKTKLPAVKPNATAPNTPPPLKPFTPYVPKFSLTERELTEDDIRRKSEVVPKAEQFLLAVLAMRRPYNGQNEKRVLHYLYTQLNQIDGTKLDVDAAGNIHYDNRDGVSRTLFVGHVDTVHSSDGVNNIKVTDSVIFANGSQLGADDGAGIAIMLNNILSDVKAYYIFTVGEEVGGVGSKHVKKNTNLLSQFDRAIAFDRKDVSSIITHQGGSRCCSDEFGNALADTFNDAGMLYMTDDGGVYTDTKEFINTIPECTNVSVGYFSEHTAQECLDILHWRHLAITVASMDWEALPTSRDPSKIESKYANYGYHNYGATKPKWVEGRHVKGVWVAGYWDYGQDDDLYDDWQAQRNGFKTIAPTPVKTVQSDNTTGRTSPLADREKKFDAIAELHSTKNFKIILDHRVKSIYEIAMKDVVVPGYRTADNVRRAIQHLSYDEYRSFHDTFLTAVLHKTPEMLVYTMAKALIGAEVLLFDAYLDLSAKDELAAMSSEFIKMKEDFKKHLSTIDYSDFRFDSMAKVLSKSDVERLHSLILDEDVDANIISIYIDKAISTYNELSTVGVSAQLADTDKEIKKGTKKKGTKKKSTKKQETITTPKPNSRDTEIVYYDSPSGRIKLQVPSNLLDIADSFSTLMDEVETCVWEAHTKNERDWATGENETQDGILELDFHVDSVRYCTEDATNKILKLTSDYISEWIDSVSYVKEIQLLVNEGVQE